MNSLRRFLISTGRQKVQKSTEVPKFVYRDQTNITNSRKRITNLLMPYIWPKEPSSRKIILGATVLLMCAKGLNAYVPFMLKQGIDTLASEHPNFTTAFMLFGGFGLGKIAVIGMQELRNTMLNKMLLSAVKDVCNKTYRHLFTLDLNYHTVSSRLTLTSLQRAKNGLQNSLHYTLNFLLPTSLEFILASGVLIGYCGIPYFATLCGTITAYSAYTFQYTKVRKEYLKEMRSKERASEFVASEGLVNYETVKYFQGEPSELKRYGNVFNNYISAARKTNKSLNALNFGQNAIFLSGLTVNLLLGVNDVSKGLLTVGDVAMIQALFLQLQFPLFWLGTIYRGLNEAQLELNELLNLLDTKSAVQEIENALPYSYNGGGISFENVSYRHEERQVISDVTFDIEPGSQVALVGQSGIGKSTIFKLMFRLFDPETGRITIDGQDLKDLTLDSFRNEISIVPQNPVLFNDSIHYNLTYGNPDATDEQIIEACKKVNMHELIMSQPDGYESQVGELGSKLSGGERQRIAIARALLKDAKIYIFDEATSAIDAKNEKAFMQIIEEVLKDKTIIFAAHRLSTVTKCDKIVVLGPSGVIEEGTHVDLLSSKTSSYGKLWKQFLHSN